MRFQTLTRIYCTTALVAPVHHPTVTTKTMPTFVIAISMQTAISKLNMVIHMAMDIHMESGKNVTMRKGEESVVTVDPQSLAAEDGTDAARVEAGVALGATPVIMVVVVAVVVALPLSNEIEGGNDPDLDRGPGVAVAVGVGAAIDRD